MNRFSKNISVTRLALGNSTGQLILRVAEPQHSGLNTAGACFAYEAVQQADIITVPMTTIDEYLERTGTPHLDVMKLDVEGMEVCVLEGGLRTLRRHRPDLLLEVSGKALDVCGSTVRELEKLLTSEGYDFFELNDDGTPTPRLASLSNMTTETLLAVRGRTP